jgi:hypothetical protein
MTADELLAVLTERGVTVCAKGDALSLRPVALVWVLVPNLEYERGRCFSCGGVLVDVLFGRCLPCLQAPACPDG